MSIEYPLDEERAKKAYETLVKYLAGSARSEQECKDKLYDKGFHKDEVDFAIDKAKGYKYVDDAEYVRTYLLFNKSRYGVRKIIYKLTTEKALTNNLSKTSFMTKSTTISRLNLLKNTQKSL